MDDNRRVGYEKNDQLGLFIKPQTFMNKSGEVISYLKKEVDFDPEHIVIVYDDIDFYFAFGSK